MTMITRKGALVLGFGLILSTWALTGCGRNAETEKADAVELLVVLRRSVSEPMAAYTKFRTAAEDDNKAGAKEGFDAFKAAVQKSKKELASVRVPPKKTAEDYHKICKNIIESEETEAMPEMAKVLKLLETDKRGEAEKRQISDHLIAISDKVLKSSAGLDNAKSEFLIECLPETFGKK
jgi:hypothetical protein